jgi:hypothetical protein
MFSCRPMRSDSESPVGVTAGAQTQSIDAHANATSLSLQGHVAMDACAALS